MAEVSETDGVVCGAFSEMLQGIEKGPDFQASHRIELKAARIFMTVRNDQMQEIVSGKLDQTSWETWAIYNVIPITAALVVAGSINIFAGFVLAVIGLKVAKDKLGDSNRYSYSKAELLVNRAFKELGFGRFNPNDISKCTIELEVSRVNYFSPVYTKTFYVTLGNQEVKKLFF